MMNGCVAVKKEPNPLLAVDAHLHPPITPYYLTTSVKTQLLYKIELFVQLVKLPIPNYLLAGAA